MGADAMLQQLEVKDLVCPSTLVIYACVCAPTRCKSILHVASTEASHSAQKIPYTMGECTILKMNDFFEKYIHVLLLGFKVEVTNDGYVKNMLPGLLGDQGGWRQGIPRWLQG
jgi:hypothetical protein